MNVNESDFRDLAESATVALHWVGPDGTILWVNQAELDMLGYVAKMDVLHRGIEASMPGVGGD